MKKIISLFKRDYKGTRLVYDEIVPGAEWVVAGEGVATLKIDGTCCLVRDGKLFKRYDRRLTKAAHKRKRRNIGFVPSVSLGHFKPAPDGWEQAQRPDLHTGHWPGWLPVGDGPEDQWHREAFAIYSNGLIDGTYELVGPKIQGNPYSVGIHTLIRHGGESTYPFEVDPPRDFNGLREWFKNTECEGIVWHHPDGRMVKIKRKDFGFDWPPKESSEQ